MSTQVREDMVRGQKAGVIGIDKQGNLITLDP
jgi:hypothetical protein